jgi:hypothetical protein
MIKYTIKHDFGNGKLKRVTLADFSLGTQRMLHLGMIAVDSLKERTAKGIGSDDTPMPPLQSKRQMQINARRVKKGLDPTAVPGYRQEKIKLGLQPIRDLRGPGDKYKSAKVGGKRTWNRVAYGGGSHMMDDLRVTYASPTQAKIDITTTMGRIKADANERTIKRLGGSGWWGFSGRDTANVIAAARAMFGPVVSQIRAIFRKAA